MTKKIAAIAVIVAAAVTVVLFMYARFANPKLGAPSAITVPEGVTATAPTVPHPLSISNPGNSASGSTETTTVGAGNSPAWQTYTDAVFHYSLIYPVTGTLSVANGGLDENNAPRLEEVTVEFIQPADASVGNFTDTFDFTLTLYDNPEQLSAKDWALKQWDSDVIRKQESTAINGVAAYQLTIFEVDQNEDYIYVAKANRIYRLAYWDPETMYDFSNQVRQYYAQTFSKMAHSFATE